MTYDELIEAFNEIEENFSYNDGQRLCDFDGFIKLRELGWKPIYPSGKPECLIACAEHDEIWLNVDLEWLASVAKKDDLQFLRNCGLMIDEDTDSLHLFV